MAALARSVSSSSVHPQLEHRIGSQRAGVVAGLVAAGDLEDTLSEKRAQRMVGIGGMSPVVESVGQTLGQSDLVIDAAQDHGAEVRGHRPAVDWLRQQRTRPAPVER